MRAVCDEAPSRVYSPPPQCGATDCLAGCWKHSTVTYKGWHTSSAMIRGSAVLLAIRVPNPISRMPRQLLWNRPPAFDQQSCELVLCSDVECADGLATQRVAQGSHVGHEARPPESNVHTNDAVFTITGQHITHQEVLLWCPAAAGALSGRQEGEQSERLLLFAELGCGLKVEERVLSRNIRWLLGDPPRDGRKLPENVFVQVKQRAGGDSTAQSTAHLFVHHLAGTRCMQVCWRQNDVTTDRQDKTSAKVSYAPALLVTLMRAKPPCSAF